VTDSRHFSRSTKRAAYARSGGRCESPTCGIALPAGWGGINYDHIINWAISRDSSLENCAVLCAACHLKKTSNYDIPVIAKVQRIADERIGIKRYSAKPLPGGRNSSVTKKLSGEVVKRQTQAEKHRAVMARRYGEQ
jgi:5-methylcytosine-specific restriction enzyme A